MSILKSLILCAATVLGVCGALAAAPPAETEKKIIVAADDWCPINCQPGAAHEGLAIDLLKKVFEPQGYKIDYRTMSWGRAIEEGRQGTLNAIVGASKMDAPDYIYPQNHLVVITDDMFIRADSTMDCADLALMRSKKIGLIKDYAYGSAINELVKQNERQPLGIQYVSGDDALQQNVNKLIAGRIDAFVDYRPVAELKLESLHLRDKVKFACGNWIQGKVYVAFSPQNKDSALLAQKFDEGVRKLDAEHSLDKFYDLYQLKK